jgi:hypothetical protein
VKFGDLRGGVRKCTNTREGAHPPLKSRGTGGTGQFCGRVWTESKVEEVIACLWTIIWVLLWMGDAHPLALWAVGIRAAGDHTMAIYFAMRR